MFKKENYAGEKEKDYQLVIKQLDALLSMENNIIANLSNTSALLNQFLNDINWIGFYLYDKDNDNLVLGPFQGLPACVRITIGKGVCGTAAKHLKSLRVDDVHKFEGHIACDSRSNSEIVIPIIVDGDLFGVLDIDSPEFSRFDAIDQQYLEKFVTVLAQKL